MDNDVAKIIGTNIKQARKAKGITQKQMAALLKKYQPDYSQYENGQIQLDYEKIVQICKILDITPTDMFDGLFN